VKRMEIDIMKVLFSKVTLKLDGLSDKEIMP